MNIDNVIQKYIAASIQYGEAQELGNSKLVNKSSGIIKRIRAQYRNDENYIIEMEKLLGHENDYVRLKASYDLIFSCPRRQK